MITARVQKNVAAAKAYYTQHLARGEYYSEQQQVRGMWFGKGAERLGLVPGSPVTQEAFERLCENLHPQTGEQLTVRRRKVDRRVCHDFTASAPKSVSVMALTLGDTRLIREHEESAREAMRQAEVEAATRQRKAGSNGTRLTGEIVAASFTHSESRALDPQLHTHFVVFNATWDPVEQRWKALQTERIFERLAFFTEVYRSELARRVQALGYTLRTTEHGFELAAVSEEVIQRFSKRRRAILKQEQKLTQELGRPLSNNARATLAHTSRERKNHQVAPEEIQRRQLAQLSPEELAVLRQAIPGPSAPPVRPAAPEVSPEAALDYARDHLFERRSVVDRTDLLAAAARFARGSLPMEELERALAQRPEFIEVDGALTTQSMLDQESRMIALVNRGVGREAPLNPGFKSAAHLSSEQRAAVEFLLGTPDTVLGLRGGAGTGKSVLLQELLRAVEGQHPVLVLAPTSAAVAELRAQGVARAATVQRYLVDEAFQAEARRRVLVVDEAGMLSTADMVRLLENVERDRCRLILSGDTRQHGSVQAGDALRLLERKSALASVGVHRIVRQVDADYREAVAAFASGMGAEALVRLRRLGALREIPEDDRYAILAADYLETVRRGNVALVVSPTWREIAQVTTRLRDALKSNQRLGAEDATLWVHHGLKWTRAQKRELKNYRPGQTLHFHSSTRNVRSGETLLIETVTPTAIEAQRADGVRVSLSRKQADCFDVGERCPLPVAVGETLLLQATSKAHRLFNGQLVTVREVHPDGSIHLKDGRRLPREYRAFTHGYAVTSIAAQGRTVDHVFVAMDSHTLNAAHLNQLYVSCSRGRKRISVYTDDVRALYDAAARSGHRLAATELVAMNTRALRPRVAARRGAAV